MPHLRTGNTGKTPNLLASCPLLRAFASFDNVAEHWLFGLVPIEGCTQMLVQSELLGKMTELLAGKEKSGLQAYMLGADKLLL